MGMGGQRQTPAALPPGNTRYPLFTSSVLQLIMCLLHIVFTKSLLHVSVCYTPSSRRTSHMYIYIYYQISATCFGVLYTILTENFAYLLNALSFLRSCYTRYVIKNKIYQLCRSTMFHTMIKTIYSSSLCILEP